MSYEGHIEFPRSLYNNPHWKSMRNKYQKVFTTLLFNFRFKEKEFKIGQEIIKIQPGQFCSSIRNLIELCNEGVKFKEDKVDKNIVSRAVSLFARIGFVRHEVRQGKSIFTVTFPELYDYFKSVSETASETKVRQKRDTKEESKNDNNDMNPPINSAYKKNQSSNPSENGEMIDDDFFVNLLKKEDPKANYSKEKISQAIEITHTNCVRSSKTSKGRYFLKTIESLRCSPKEEEIENRGFSEMMIDSIFMNPYNTRIEILTKGVEISTSAQGDTKFIDFKQKGFKEQLENCLRKKGIVFKKKGVK